MTEPVRVPKAASIVAASLRRRIVLGDLTEGDALPNETELMRFYDVSRPTLREALRILETESLISVKRGARGGARVAIPDPLVTAHHAALVLRMQGTSLKDVFVARLIIEPAAVRLLAARAREDPAVLAPLVRLNERAEDVLADRAGYASVAAQFHEQVIELAGNRTLTLVGLILMEIVEPHNRATFEVIQHGDQVVASAQHDHAALLDALALGDEETAAAIWRSHMQSAMDAALTALGESVRIDLLEMSGSRDPSSRAELSVEPAEERTLQNATRGNASTKRVRRA